VLESEGAASAPAPAAAVPAPSTAPAPTASPAPALAATSGPIDVVVPDIGDFAEIAVIEVLVKPGDTVKAEQSLITVESDKASMEIPSSHAGVVKEMKVRLGDKVSKGSVIATIESSGTAAAPAAAPASVAAPAGSPGAAAAPAAEK